MDLTRVETEAKTCTCLIKPTLEVNVYIYREIKIMSLNFDAFGSMDL